VKYRQKIYAADQAHLHHRFLRRRYSQKRATVTIWIWCGTLAAAALATRFVPFSSHGDWDPGWTLVAVGIGLVAVGFSFYVVYLLEIVKWANPRTRRQRRDKAA
jgi:hypothetical protein